MNIVYAVHHLPPQYTGGAEHRALRTARWFQSHGHTARLICIESIERDAPAVDEQGRFIPLRFASGTIVNRPCSDPLLIRRLSFDHRALGDGKRWTYDNPIVEQRIAEFLAEHRPDVFHLFSGYLMTAGAIRAARTAGVPIAISLTDFWFLCPRITLLRSDGTLCPRPPHDPMGCVRCLAEERRRYRWPARIAPPLAAAAWRIFGAALPPGRAAKAFIQDRRKQLSGALASADALICPSQFLHDRFRAQGVAPDKLHLMRQGLSLPPRTAPVHRDRARPVIGYRGQIKHHKGVDLVIEAASALAAQGFQFTLAIYGNEREEPRYTGALKRRTRGMPWVEWRGVHPHNEVWQVMAGLDVAVVPSRWYENSPNTILEAQAAGVPVVATNLGGMAELVQHDVSGLLFEANDARDLSAQLARLLNEPGLLDRLRSGAPAVTSMNQEMSELSSLYERIVAAKDERR